MALSACAVLASIFVIIMNSIIVVFIELHSGREAVLLWGALVSIYMHSAYGGDTALGPPVSLVPGNSLV